jgi:hypothetical protein
MNAVLNPEPALTRSANNGTELAVQHGSIKLFLAAQASAPVAPDEKLSKEGSSNPRRSPSRERRDGPADGGHHLRRGSLRPPLHWGINE